MSSKYDILSIAGSGTFGTVVKARQLDHPLQRTVALKVMRKLYVYDERVASRTRDEARILAILDHPNIVRVHAFESHDDRPIVVMDWVEGLSLGDVIDSRPGGIAPDVAVSLARDIADALHHAWTCPGPDGRPMHLVHRDLKPNNALLSTSGRLQIVDFGTAKADFSGREAVTQSMVLGTRAYLAPERLDGSDDHPSGDVYAAGLMLQEMLTGQAVRLSLNQRKHDHVLTHRLERLEPDGLTEAEVAPLRELVRQMCSYEPEDRPGHEEVVQRLTEWQTVRRSAAGVRRWCERAVAPVVEGRRDIDPRTHPDWGEVAFLISEEAPPKQRAPKRLQMPSPTPSLEQFVAPPPPPPPPLPPASLDEIRDHERADAMLRELLQSPRWERELPKLHRLARRNSDWTDRPLLEILDQAVQPRWQVWTRPPAKKVAVALELLRQRPSAAAGLRAESLANHADPMVKHMARKLLKELEPR